jgi:hypothetical protein
MSRFALLSGLIIFLYSCQKQTSQSDNCNEIQQVRIVTNEKELFVGDDLHLTVNQLPTIALFGWTHSQMPNELSSGPELHFTNIEKKHEGWYYLSVSYPECTTHFDSIYITVKNKPGTAPCTPANNTVTFSSIPDLDPASVSWRFDNSWNRKSLVARGPFGYPDLDIYFNAYWNTREPEDGEYNVVSMSATGGYPPYTVFISATYTSIYFQSSAGKVYVSHQNDKIQATFCNVELSGSNGGPSYKTTASGKLTAP